MRSTPAIAATLLALGVLIAGCSSDTEAPVLRDKLQLTGLRTEYKEDPVGIDSRIPRLSWKLESPGRGVLQSAYQIRVAQSETDVRRGMRLLWDSGKVDSGDSTLRPYTGPPLQSAVRYYWQVRVWDAGDRPSTWSEPAFWEMGLLSTQDWKTHWIEPALQGDVSRPAPAPMLRREFALGSGIQRARAYVTSHGLYELHLNGRRVGDQLFTPGWTSYQNRLQYQTYDVTDLLKSGDNAVGVLLGDGWYRGQIGFTGERNRYGERLALLIQIQVTYDDGRTEVIGSDRGWKAATGPILMSEIYAGELYDARLERRGWDTAEYDDADWSRVKVVDASRENLIAPAGPPVKRIQELQPVRVLTTPKGERVFDFGQNLVGWVRLRVQGPGGARVVLRHAEVLDAEGNFYTENLRGAAQTVRYILKGKGVEIFEPHFTFQGFRYVSVDGYPGELSPQSLTAIVIHSQLERTGTFETSNELVNRLQKNIVWGQKGNFLDVPTDCPQRDERLGWTGDAQVFAPTAAFNMNVAGFFGKWLQDLQADQFADGSVPFVVPDVVRVFDGKPAGGAAGWADAATVIPWEMYLAYGDRSFLDRQYDSMRRWVQYQQMRAGADFIWDGDFTFGDWLDFFGAQRGTSFGATSTDLISTAYFARSTDILRRSAEVLGRKEDAARYAALFSDISAAFARKFVAADGTVGEGTQTAYVLALDFDLLPDDLRPAAAARLAEDVRRRGHLTTGFLGTPELLWVLSRFGYLDEAYMLLNREEYPSWLYPVKRGATTIWERWDGQKPDGSFQDPSMNSFNHYAYGAVGSWMYRVMAGLNIDPAAPGYKHALIQPQPGGRYTHVSASLETSYGRLSSAWELKDGMFELAIEVPANTSATVRLPRAQSARVRESGELLADAEDVRNPRQEGNAVAVDIGSGRYRFTYPMAARRRD